MSDDIYTNMNLILDVFWSQSVVSSKQAAS